MNDPILEPVKLILDDKTARSFETFCKYEPVFKTLIEAGVFDTKSGQVTMNFNHLGHLMDIEVKVKTYHNGPKP